MKDWWNFILTNKGIPVQYQSIMVFLYSLNPTLYSKRWLWWHDLHPAPDPRREYYWEFLVGLCRPILQILTLFQTKKCHFPHPFSDQISKLHTHLWTWPNLACSRLSDSWETPQISPLLFSVWAFSIQWTQLPYLGAWNRLGLIGRNYVIITKIECKKKKFSKCILNSHIYISFLFIWNWNDKYIHSCTLP